MPKSTVQWPMHPTKIGLVSFIEKELLKKKKPKFSPRDGADKIKRESGWGIGISSASGSEGHPLKP